MFFSSFDEMQKAVDIVNDSPHPTNKIAATIFGTTPDNRPYSLSRTNYWPAAIADHIGADNRIGNSSGTVHAETACILAAVYTNGASLCVTDPFCPNCAKNMAEAGIRTVYIDHKGFDKDFAARRGDAFDSMSMQICERAGISVYEIRRREKKLSPILEIPETYLPPEDNPVDIEPVDSGEAARFRELVLSHRFYGEPNWAAAIAVDSRAQHFLMAALAHPVPGFTAVLDQSRISHPPGKYSFILEPVGRLLMNAPRRGLKIVDGLIFSAQVPTARELVNLAGAAITAIHTGATDKARDAHALKAMKLLSERGILQITDLS